MNYFYTMVEVAAKFGVTEGTVRKWASSGKIKCIKTLGGHYRFPKKWVDDHLEASREISNNRST